MICPKCGYEQEERLDCLKCGVIFSKYYSLFPSARSAAPGHEEDPDPHEPLDQSSGTIISDLRLQVRELGAKINAAEFEKAERNQVKTDLKNLEQQLKENLERVESRMAQFEKTLEGHSSSQIQKELFDALAASALGRLEQIENRLEALSKDPGSKIDPRILEILRKFEQRIVESENKAAGLLGDMNAREGEIKDIGLQVNALEEKAGNRQEIAAELQDQLTVLRDEVVEIKCELGLFQQRLDELSQSSQEPKTLLEEDVHAIRENLDGIRRFISASMKL